MKVKSLKLKYPKGSRIEVVNMDDTQAVPPGTQGKVDFVDDMGTIHVSWDNGSTLGLIDGQDDFVLLESPQKNYEVKKINLKINAPVVAKDTPKPQTHIVKNAIKLSHIEYLKLQQNPVYDRDYIKDFVDEMYVEDNTWHSILVYCDEEQDGLLVESEGFHYARYTGHLPKIHDLIETNFVNEIDPNKFEKIKVLVVEPGMKPYLAIIDNNLETSQGLVGGYIETIYLSNTAEIIANEEGKLLNLKANRRLGNDVIAGRFFIVGVDGGEHFTSLSNEDIKKYSEQFQDIEMIDQKEVQEAMKMEVIY